MVDNQVITAASSKIIDADISLASIIHLHESNKSFSIDFSALTYGREVQGHYSYRMRGFEEEWNTLKPGEHSVRYTSLKPGSYVFEVAYTAEADEDERHVISIRVEVAPYFWKSWWFTMLLALLAIGVVIWLYRLRLEAWRKQEAEKLLKPIRKALEETEDAGHLQSRIQNILDNHERLEKSYHRSVEADKQEVIQKNVPFMERATEIMEQNYMNSEFDITAFAEALGMSKSLVSKRLNAETGVSTGQFIRNYRLSIAKKLIMENYADRNITEIAYAVGFNDPKYFTRCFSRQYGCSPSTYMRDDHTEKGKESK
jgi:AraC-like DNA-binding protein